MLHIHDFSNSSQGPDEEVPSHPDFTEEENKTTERLGNLPQVTQLRERKGRAGLGWTGGEKRG